MSKLSKMNISGIRSFGPEERDLQRIKFNSPVTLFLGQNGCGKTTIIESLKFAITGDLPGGTKSGQGFIYDPLMARSVESRGQVKVQIFDVKGTPVTVSKTAKVFYSRNKATYKLIDSTITRDETNISNRCAEVHTEMCLAMGVSRAILNSVIFCHQEDSHWPLEEPKKLKERFDDIFDATKYNKCIDYLIKTRKRKTDDLKRIAIELDHCKEKKAITESKRDNLREKEERLEKLKEALENTNRMIEPITYKLEELCTMEANVNKLQTEAELKKNRLKHLREQQQEILSNSKEFLGTDEELCEKISSFEADLTVIQREIMLLQKKKQEIEHLENKLRSNIDTEQVKLGHLQAESKQNENNIKTRSNLIEEIITEHKIKTNSNWDTVDIIKGIQQYVEVSQIEAFDLEKKGETKEKELQGEIDTCRENYAQLKQNIESKEQQLKDLKQEGHQIQNKLNELNMSDMELNLIETRLARTEKEISGLEASVDVGALREKIESEKTKSNAFEEQLSVVENEIQILQTYSSLQTELDLQNENLFKRQNELQKLKNKHGSDFEHMFGTYVPKINLKDAVEMYSKKQLQLIKDVSNKVTDKQQEVTKLETNINMQREKLATLEKEFKESRKIIDDQFKGQSFKTVEEDLHNSIEVLQKDKGSYSSSKYLYQRFIAQFQRNEPSCPICNRHVKEKNEIKDIIDSIQKKIEDFPEKLIEVEKKLTETQKKYSKILELKPTYERVENLQEIDIPNLKKIISDNEIKLESLTKILSDLKIQLTTPQKNQDLASSLMSDATLIDQYNIDIEKITNEISIITSRIPKNKSSRSMVEAMAEQDFLKLESKAARTMVESLRNKLSQHAERLQKQKDTRNELIAKQLSIKKDLQGEVQLKEKHTELVSKINNIQTEIKEAKEEIEPMRVYLQTAVKKKDEFKAKHKKIIEDVWTRVNNGKKKLEDIVKLQKNIDDFIKKGVLKEIQSVSEKIENFRSDLRKHSEEKLAITKKSEELNQQVLNRKMYYRELQDNVKLREKRKQETILKTEIEEYDKKLSNSDMKKLHSEKRKLEQKLSDLFEERSRAEGKKSEQQESIKELKKELSQSMYANAVLNYKEKFLEYKILYKATEDLNHFAKAMDWSMLQYHKKQMVHVNEIIRELWRTIYRGNDIDYIEIKTENDTPTASLDKRRVYNYRLVQVKNDVELDMRGRCSAGQKVLASLIIRIALADTFSSKCGILALDEPTTNLDKENIISLSDALVDLIERKKRQKNFQLLIITHDQDFLERLSRAEQIDQYYVVSRNSDGKSVIMKQNASF